MIHHAGKRFIMQSILHDENRKKQLIRQDILHDENRRKWLTREDILHDKNRKESVSSGRVFCRMKIPLNSACAAIYWTIWNIYLILEHTNTQIAHWFLILCKRWRGIKKNVDSFHFLFCIQLKPNINKLMLSWFLKKSYCN